MESIILALGLSIHPGLEGDYNNFHPHIRFIEDGAIAGAYYNSVERISLYGGYRLEYNNAGVELALVTGYPAFGTVAPMIRGTYDVESTRFFIAPATERYGNNNNNMGAIIGIEFTFDK